MPFDRPVHRGQADPGAGEVAGVVQPGERPEQLAGLLGGEAGPVVAHVVAPVVPAHLDHRLFDLAAELHRVVDQVLQDHPDQALVGVGGHALADGERHPPVRVPGGDFRDDAAGRRGQVELRPAQLTSAGPGQDEQRLHQVRHPHRGGVHPGQPVPGHLAQHLTVLLLQDVLGETGDHLQRPAQVVRYRAGERLQLLVAPLQLLDQGGPGLGELPGGPLLGGVQLAAHQLLADPAGLVVRLLAADLGPDVRQQPLRDVHPAHVVVRARGQAVQHGVLVAGHDHRQVADLRHLPDPAAGVAGLLHVVLEADHDAVRSLLGEQLQSVVDGG